MTIVTNQTNANLASASQTASNATQQTATAASTTSTSTTNTAQQTNATAANTTSTSTTSTAQQTTTSTAQQTNATAANTASTNTTSPAQQAATNITQQTNTTAANTASTSTTSPAQQNTTNTAQQTNINQANLPQASVNQQASVQVANNTANTNININLNNQKKIMSITYTTQNTTSNNDKNTPIPTDDQIGITSTNRNCELNSLNDLKNNQSGLNDFLVNVLNGNVQAVSSNTSSENLMSQSTDGNAFNALTIAVFNNDVAMVQALIANAIHLLNNDVIPVTDNKPDKAKITTNFQNFIDLVDNRGFTAFGISSLVVSDNTIIQTTTYDDNSQNNTNVTIWFLLSNLYASKYTKDADQTYPLMNLIFNGKYDLLQNLVANHKLIHNGTIDDYLSNYTLSNACTSSTDQILTYLISQGANVNAKNNIDGHVPLISAVQVGNPGYMQKLLDGGADQTIADNQGYTPAAYAFMSYAAGVSDDTNLQIVQTLVNDYQTKHNADLRLIQDSLGKNAFHYMALTGIDPSFVNYVMDAISSAATNPLNVNDNEGKTPFYVAMECDPSLLIPYIKSGADVNCQVASTGMRPILLAAQNANTAVMALLLNKNYDCKFAVPADVKVTESAEGATALHFVVRNGQSTSINNLTKMANYLLQAGADINAQLTSGNYQGNTPLHDCALNDQDYSDDQYNLAQFLVQYGGARDIVNSNGQHFWELAPADKQEEYHDLVGQMSQ